MVYALRQRLVTDISGTVQFFAIVGFLVSVLGLAVRPDLRVTFEFAMVGVAIASAIVLLSHEKREEAATALWYGSVALILVSCDIVALTGTVLCIFFGFFCLWLMWYIMPVPTGRVPEQ